MRRAEWSLPFAPKLLGQQAGLDADRTGDGAEPARGAGFEPLVIVELAHRGGACLVAHGTQARDLAPADDAMPGRKRHSLRRAHPLAEAAFHALVDDRIRRRQRLQVLQVRLRIVVEDDAGVEQAGGVENALDFAHEFVGLRAPFQLDERRHVAARPCSAFSEPS